MVDPQNEGPWGKTGDVEIASPSPKPQSMAPLQAAADYSSPLAWFKQSFRFKNMLSRKDYFKLIFMPVMLFLMSNIWLQRKIMPAFQSFTMAPPQSRGDFFKTYETYIITYQNYFDNLPQSQQMLIIVVSFLMLFFLYSLSVITIKRLRDGGIHAVIGILITLLFWPFAVILGCILPSQQHKIRDSYER